MAMLAEPRRKQKFSVDPRNLNWSNDESKFGQKMLEKMGWSKGKGLGATEQGEVDHIKINVKNDARGVGCTAKYGDTWLAHQDDFNSLLANLNAQHSAPNSGTSTPDGVTSLERSSKSSKARVHYGKFTRGKDLSTRGADELECIFGKKRRKTADESLVTEEASASPPDEPENTEDAPESEVKHFTSTQSVADYFAQKMAALQRLRNGTDSSASSPAPGETCSPEPDKSRNSPEDSENDKMDCVSESVNENRQSEEKTKKKKKKTKEMVEDVIMENEEDSGSGSQEVKKKKKKRKLLEDVHDSQDKEESSTEPPAKKKKKKCKKAHKTDPEMNCDDVIVQTERTKKKSKRGQESDPQKLDDNESSDRNPVISEKKSKKKTKTESTDDKNSRTNEENSSSKSTAEKSKKKKKKKNKIGMKERIRKQKMMNSQSGSSKRYVIDKKSGKKIFIDDLELEKKFKGSNVSEVGPYGRAK